MMAIENQLKVDGTRELRRYIHSCYYGHTADYFGDQLLGEAVIHDRLGLDPLGHIYTGHYALMAPRYWKTFGKSSPAFRRTMSKIAVKNRGYACSNPFAQAPARNTVKDVEIPPIVADPLRFYDACLMSVGASCVLLCGEATAYTLSDNPMRFWIAAGSHTLRTADRRRMEIPLLPAERESAAVKRAYRKLPGTEKTERYPGFTGFLAARMAAFYAYGMSGVVDPCEDLDRVELHDAFTISDIQPVGRPHRLHARRGRDGHHAGRRGVLAAPEPLGLLPRAAGNVEALRQGEAEGLRQPAGPPREARLGDQPRGCRLARHLLDPHAPQRGDQEVGGGPWPSTNSSSTT